jgi:hypothetical protein
MRFVSKGLNPFKIQTRFKFDFYKFYNSKYIEIWKLSKKNKVVSFEFIYQLAKF